MSKISQMIKQNQEKKNQQNLIYQEKLKQLIHNNNLFVQELKKLEEINSNSESRLIELKSDLEYVEDLYIQLFLILEDMSERFQSIQDRTREDKKSNTDKKSSLKSSKTSKQKTIKEVSSEVDLNRIRTVLNTLLTHYDKTLTVNKWEPARGWFLLVRGWPARSGRFFCHNFVGVFDKNLSEYFSFSYDIKNSFFSQLWF